MKYLLIIILIVSYSCKPKEKTPVTVLYDEVMVIHDEAMPLMGDIHKQSKKLKKILKSEDITEAQKGIISNQLGALVNADEQMMEWMAAFDQPKNVSDEESAAYLSRQKESISKVNDQMITALKDSKNLTSQFN